MTDTIDDSLGALRNEIEEFCEEHDLEPDEADLIIRIGLFRDMGRWFALI